MNEKLEKKIQQDIDENLESINEMVFEFVDSDGRSDESRRYLCDMLTVLSNERRRLFDLRDMLCDMEGENSVLENSVLVIQAEGILVCTFLRREIDTVRSCINEADEKTGSVDNDKRLLASLIETYNWIADVTENEELRDLIPENSK